ncbi:helix-turn-helix domain-containing protein [Bacillus taeanensis]|nr:helix-turn-helix domain-containing protein [Bacillus taeanensis]
MEAIKPVVAFLNDLCNEVSYEIWMQDPNDTSYRLIYAKGEMEEVNINVLTSNKDEKYDIFYEGDNRYISFQYSSGYSVLLRSRDAFPLTKHDLDYLFIGFDLFYTKNLMQTKDVELNTVIDSIRSVSSSLVVDELLKKIVKNALSVIPTANAGFLQLYDDEEERLVPKAAVGFGPEMELFKIKPGESITGMVYEVGEPLIYHSKDEIYKSVEENEISKENLVILNASIKNKSVHALVSVPVSIGTKRIGVMTIHQFNTNGKFTEADLRLLQGFASQAAVAIQNARLYTEVKERLQELSNRNEVHETLIKLSLQNKGIPPIVKEISRMMNNKISFFDYVENEWYHSKETQKAPFHAEEILQIVKKENGLTTIEMCQTNIEHYYLYPIVNGSVFLGCFVFHSIHALSFINKMIIEQGGAILALELVKKHTLEEIYYKKTHEFFNELIESKEPQLLIAKRKEFNLDPASYFFAGVVELVNYKDFHKLEADIHSIISLIKKKVSAVNLIYGFHNKIIFLGSLTARSVLTGIIKELKTIINTWTSSHDGLLYGGIGSSKQGAHHIAKSYYEAKKAAVYMINKKETGIIAYESIGVNRLFINQDTNEIQEFLEDFFKPLHTTRAKKNQLELTLLTYIELNKSVNETANHLHIHINTLYQRLKKIEELLQLNLNDPKDSLKIQLACHLKETFVFPGR